MGIKGPTADYPCIECHCHKNQSHRIDIVFNKRSFKTHSNVKKTNSHDVSISIDEDEESDYIMFDEHSDGKDADLGNMVLP